ncbi:heterokaryon incompatibility protein-domain-containing protein [Immersiella caudata]|uniref:Heterokaryon incompatibility protein-domain-containing protein n=1 Tax=Immersiella caudata TaxID=314043 RepID=A0AA40C0C3_9PEZI|nr:heterokaryon incompatibility protein-domain-containing protein [Immersiella caudata]
MRLLDTGNIQRVDEFVCDTGRPPYAILSHVWEPGEEVSLRELSEPANCAHKKGYRKTEQACAMAAKNGFQYVWIDTCCFERGTSAELNEAINSMFRWYQEAAICYVFLADLLPEGPGPGPISELDFASSLSKCKWFTRGWTLQELIAPRGILFFDQEWNFRGSKSDLCELISSITDIPRTLLNHEAELSEFTAARNMSWAAGRKTTRLEDEAYCILGLFDVHMTLLYGEGRAAFIRLQETILARTGDLSILAWADEGEGHDGGHGHVPGYHHYTSRHPNGRPSSAPLRRPRSPPTVAEPPL